MGQVVRCTQVQSMCLVGRRHNAQHAAKKTGRPVFLCVLPATSRTHMAHREYGKQKFWVSTICVCVMQSKHAGILGYFITKENLPRKRLLLCTCFRSVKEWGISAHPPGVLRNSEVRGECYYPVLVKYVTLRWRMRPARYQCVRSVMHRPQVPFLYFFVLYDLDTYILARIYFSDYYSFNSI